MIALRFKPWNKFHAEMDPDVFKRYLQLVAKESENAFKRGANRFKTGRIYRYNGRDVQASGPGDWPAKRSGALLGSIQTRVLAKEVEIGTNISYGPYLAGGTSKMAKRKMMKEALQEGMKNARSRLKNWVKWEMG
jgi:hypothetical protein